MSVEREIGLIGRNIADRHNQSTKMTPSKEDYLKIMLELSNGGGIQSSSIADALGISRASVSCMMKVLKDDGYVAKEKYGTASLTESGKRVAVNVKRRYDLLKRFFNDVVGVNTATAAEDACRVEHLISVEAMDKIACWLENYAENNNDKINAGGENHAER
ncbi:MAG: metal-dependent transcriptional regulator [Eubacteriales bacterium]|nr:metal-dependent transcriptional regulator [Eubacteriales bacterium]